MHSAAMFGKDSVVARRWQAYALDALSLRFVVASRNARDPLLDFGCNEGLAASAALARGAHVVAVDSSEACIDRLIERVPFENLHRLRAEVAQFLEAEFENEEFEAIHSARSLQQLEGEDVAEVLSRFHRWLQPQGRLFVSVLSPAGDFWSPLGEQMLERAREGVRWPGYIENVSNFTSDPIDSGPIHLLDEVTVRRELGVAGFKVEEAMSYPLPWDPMQYCFAAIARKCN
jgi:SAM-dependent methyltransferase